MADGNLVVWANGRFYRRPAATVRYEQQITTENNAVTDTTMRALTGNTHVTVMVRGEQVAIGDEVHFVPGRHRPSVQHVIVRLLNINHKEWIPNIHLPDRVPLPPWIEATPADE